MALIGACLLFVAACSESDASASGTSDLGSETTLVADGANTETGDGGRGGVFDGASGAGRGEAADGDDDDGDDADADDDSSESQSDGVASNENGGAQALKLLVTGLDEVPSDVVDFFNETSEERIDELAEATCRRLDPDLPVTELGVMTIVGRGELTPREQELLDLNEYRVAVGAIAGVYCPEQLPLDAELLEVEFDLGDPDAYRETLPKFLPPEHRAIDFVEQLDDDRLETLHETACEAAEGGRALAEIGVSVLNHYNSELTAAEREQIEFGEYIDFVGSLLGWFCPDQLVGSELSS